MNREQPSFAGWLFGRMAYPSHPVRCRGCGIGVVEGEVARTLRRQGERSLAAWLELCPVCRRQRMRERIAAR